MSTINYDSKKSIRGAFGEELAELGKNIPNVVALDADLSGSTQTSLFAKAFRRNILTSVLPSRI